jgi:hypothetical protein
MTKLFKLALMGLIAATFILSACKKDKIDEPEVSPLTIEELDIPTGFNWQTQTNYFVKLEATENGIVEVLNKAGVPYVKAYLTANQSYNMKLTVPAFEVVVTLRFRGSETSLNLDAQNLEYTFD